MITKEHFTQKAINFDLNTKALQEIFQSNNPFVYMEGYKEVGRFLKSHGFTHRQWSGYISKEPMTSYQIAKLVIKMNKSLPWLCQCVKRFDVTDIGEQHDLMHIFQKAEKAKLQEKVSEQQDLRENSAEKSKSIISRESILKSAKIIAQKESYTPKKEHSKDNSL